MSPRLRATGTHRGQAASSQAGHLLPPHPKQQNRHRERVPASTCPPRAIQWHSAQAECVQEVAGHTRHGDIGCWQCFGDSPSASILQPRRSSHLEEAMVGHVSMSSWLHSSGTAPGNAGAPRTPPEPAQRSTEAPAATGTPQCPQFRTGLALNSKLSSNCHTGSLPRPEQPARQQDCPQQSQ